MRYDPLDEATLTDPYPVLAALRDQAPATWHEGMECRLVTCYADCLRVRRVLRDHQHFVATRGAWAARCRRSP